MPKVVMSATAKAMKWVKSVHKELKELDGFENEDDCFCPEKGGGDAKTAQTELDEWTVRAAHADVFVAFLDEEYLASTECVREFNIAQTTGKCIVVALDEPERLAAMKPKGDSSNVLAYLANESNDIIFSKAGPGFKGSAIAAAVERMAAPTTPGKRDPTHRAVFRIEKSGLGISIIDGDYRLGGRCRSSEWYEHLDHPGLKIVYAFGRWSFPNDAIRSLLQMYTTDLSLPWDQNPGAVGFLVPDDISAIHCDAHAKRPPCTGWESTGEGKPLPIRVVYLVDGQTIYPQPPSFVAKSRRSFA